MRAPEPAAIVVYVDSRHREGVLKLWREVFAYEAAHNDPELVLKKKWVMGDDLLLVAQDEGGEVRGTIMLGYDGHRGWIYALAVDAAVRYRGLGSALVKKGEEVLRDLGCVKINLQVLKENEGVLAFYRKLGYEIEARVSMGKHLPENVAGFGRED